MTRTSGTPTPASTMRSIREAALRSGGVCRNLFGGPVDHEQLSRDLNARLRDISEQDARRWNFNFQCGAPMAGSFQWEEAECAAPFYQEKVCASRMSNPEEEEEEEEMDSVCCSLQKKKNTAEEPALLEINQENSSSVSNTQKTMMPAAAPLPRRKRSSSQASSKATTNSSKITDFFVKRRRTSETKNILNPLMPSDQTRSQRI